MLMFEVLKITVHVLLVEKKSMKYYGMVRSFRRSIQYLSHGVFVFVTPVGLCKIFVTKNAKTCMCTSNKYRLLESVILRIWTNNKGHIGGNLPLFARCTFSWNEQTNLSKKQKRRTAKSVNADLDFHYYFSLK